MCTGRVCVVAVHATQPGRGPGVAGRTREAGGGCQARLTPSALVVGPHRWVCGLLRARRLLEEANSVTY